VQFTSVGHGGRYQPRNIGAVWVETTSGQFVKTIYRWAGIRAGDLTRWNQVSGGWGLAGFFGGGSTSSNPDQVDVMTGATVSRHQSHTATWNMKTGDGMLVADGAYKVFVEVTEDRRGPYASVDFQKGSAPQNITPPDQAPWVGLTLSYEP
jgi:hypothetical protein